MSYPASVWLDLLVVNRLSSSSSSYRIITVSHKRYVQRVVGSSFFQLHFMNKSLIYVSVFDQQF